MNKKVNVLFVCLGNICRSPMAQGAFERCVLEAGLESLVGADSAGTHAFHVGSSPDKRAIATALKRKIDIAHQRARRVKVQDFRDFDYVIAMDRDNYGTLRYACPAGRQHALHMFLDFSPELRKKEVPDPYYGGDSGFDTALDLIQTASGGLLLDIREAHLSGPEAT